MTSQLNTTSSSSDQLHLSDADSLAFVIYSNPQVGNHQHRRRAQNLSNGILSLQTSVDSIKIIENLGEMALSLWEESTLCGKDEYYSTYKMSLPFSNSVIQIQFSKHNMVSMLCEYSSPPTIMQLDDLPVNECDQIRAIAIAFVQSRIDSWRKKQAENLLDENSLRENQRSKVLQKLGILGIKVDGI